MSILPWNDVEKGIIYYQRVTCVTKALEIFVLTCYCAPCRGELVVDFFEKAYYSLFGVIEIHLIC